ncbi:MAG: hypothetical protein E5V66_01905 [Mesorhizobium sp.]|uniref:hypothetical protein n=2 Tax=Mesorhizobium TaxID=68287 RepID=UPI000F75E8CE|nr:MULTISPECIES: hypothetical protein [unclassified Mesorhizobium]AZO47233.1 hypothetical protein EJ073_04860 [Mesorhizobium sp. M4B.F.Ca.ET.058.02.1.1]RWD13970.1 MAG: hypothetical protein EOS74_18440 [Mesorhizobium sp.]RWD55683.1 MAG: hypothetical protein EOS75_17165 [Mesorhizobium sp.]TIW13889.1 MAG: hypothetical protein E5V66_01905 [Mesorhizobium sp.]
MNAMAKTTPLSPTEVRLRVKAHGYSPLPNKAKECVLREWPTVEATEELITKKWSRMLGCTATGIRLDDDLAVIDIDVDDEVQIKNILNRLYDAFPDTLGNPDVPLLIRHGGGAKLAIFIRTDEPFSRIASRGWTKPGETVDDGVHKVEIFSSASARQFGAVGPRSFAKDGSIETEYRYKDRSPLDTPKSALPLVTKKRCFEVADIVEEVLDAAGWSPVERTTKGESSVEAKYDLTEDMKFDCKDGVTRTLAELPDAAAAWRVAGQTLRCSAAWLEGPGAKKTERCIIGLDHAGNVFVHEFTTGNHYPVSAAPEARDIKVTDLAQKLKEKGYAPPRLIQVKAGALHELATEAEQALLEAHAPFYVHGGAIKRPVVEEVEASHGHKTKVARLTPATPDMMRDHLSRVANWEKYDLRSKKLVPTDPPRDVAATLLARDGEWKLPKLVGVITTPTLRPDGTILSEPGYDPETRLLLVEPPMLPPIPDQPTRDAALAALGTLDALLAEFPFVNDASRSVALSELITPVVRGAMTLAPLHANTAPEAGTGKSYIVDIASAIVSGQRCPVFAAGHTGEETDKRIGAALMTGQALVSIDNLNGELGGSSVCQAVERPVVDVRVLGQSKNVRVENRATFFANGNNIKLVEDVVRRTILCSLDANMERPEQREFKAKPYDLVIADRGRYIAAALVIVRAYVVAGCPDTLPALASFEDWSRLVRSALVWLGRADPVETQEAARRDDPSKNLFRQFVASWRETSGTDQQLTATELKKLAEEKTNISPFEPKHLELHAALVAIAAPPGRGEISALRLGVWLGERFGQIVDGVKLHGGKDKHTKVNVYWLTETAPHGSGAGEG